MSQGKKTNSTNKKHIWIGIFIILSIISLVSFVISASAENTGGTAAQREDEKTLVRMTASLSRGKDSSNQVNIDTLAEELNRYAGNGVTTVTEKSSDTLLVTFVSTGNEYEININTGPAFDSTTDIEELPSTTETIPYLPSGFSMVAGTDLDTGLTKQDSLGNQYVWVEVPKTTTVYPTAGLAINNFTDDEYTAIENDLHTYTSTYRNSTSATDTYYSDETTGLTSSEYTALKQKMLKSVYQNGGFYVGKYETGIADSYRTGEGDATETPVIKANAYPYNYVTCSQAQSLASSMSSGEYTSSLMFGVQWDLVLKYLETKGSTVAELNEDSTSLGNYYNNLWNITNTSAKYSSSANNWAWTSGAYGEKTASDSVLLSTGASSTFSKQGISDLAGNVWEWTLEYTSNSSYPCAYRGGFYSYYGYSNPASNRNDYSTTGAYGYIGIRVALY